MAIQFRKDYPGEFVLVETKFANGKKEQKREWIANPITNQHLTAGAACISSSANRERFDYSLLQRHRGGLYGSKKLQTYGTAKIAGEMRLDFTIDLKYNNLIPLIENRYTEENVVYTTARNCIRRPGEFYLIPQASHLCIEALPLYIAAFDQHEEIYMLGYDNDMGFTRSDSIQQVAEVMQAYSSTQFTMVGVRTNMPSAWMSCPNTRNFTYQEFIGHCDI